MGKQDIVASIYVCTFTLDISYHQHFQPISFSLGKLLSDYKIHYLLAQRVNRMVCCKEIAVLRRNWCSTMHILCSCTEDRITCQQSE